VSIYQDSGDISIGRVAHRSPPHIVGPGDEHALAAERERNIAAWPAELPGPATTIRAPVHWRALRLGKRLLQLTAGGKAPEFGKIPRIEGRRRMATRGSACRELRATQGRRRRSWEPLARAYARFAPNLAPGLVGKGAIRAENGPHTTSEAPSQWNFATA
jgi:hypothetical protein